ncbi:hypothetical protein [Streptomyces sp. SP2-10]|uniref:hypothetical protein n=1 Tax=Streptomyces sp. SP2-10 TaxID=2873385 RepID=UPI001CA7160F|nr:hypothetical protein [Streptomyces sp. SP2-10]MBY8841426.1 hypothetical protein [Streptomyces sp. SP2-10]
MNAPEAVSAVFLALLSGCGGGGSEEPASLTARQAEAGQAIATRWETIEDSTDNINCKAAHEAAKAHHARFAER